jgi:hypothetical protein
MRWLPTMSCCAGLALATATLPGSVLGQDFPQPPCGAPARPGYPAPGAAPVLRSWQVETWTPPDCAGWSSSRATLLSPLRKSSVS